MSKKENLPKNKTMEDTTENPLENLTDDEMMSLTETVVKLQSKISPKESSK